MGDEGEDEAGTKNGSHANHKAGEKIELKRNFGSTGQGSAGRHKSTAHDNCEAFCRPVHSYGAPKRAGI